MGLKGDLSSFSLAEVFQLISTSQKEGTLIVDDGESRKVIYFNPAGVKLLSSGTRKGLPLGELLIRAGLITAIQLKDTLARQKKSGRRLGEILCDLEIIKKEDLEKTLRFQIEEEIYDLFTWSQANFEFIEGPPPEEFQDTEQKVTSLQFDANALVFEAARRIDEWDMIKKAIPQYNIIFNLTEQGQQLLTGEDTPAETKAILPLINGENTVDQIVKDSPIPRFNTAKVIYNLIQASAVKEITLEEIQGLAAQAVQDNNLARARALYQQGLKIDPKNISVNENLAQVLESLEQPKEAGNQYKELAKILVEQEAWEQVAETYRKVIKCLPDSLDARQCLFDLMLQLNATETAKKEVPPDGAEAEPAGAQPESDETGSAKEPELLFGPEQITVAGKDFLKLLVEKKEVSRAFEVSQRLLDYAPPDFELQSYIASIYYELGDFKKSREVIDEAINNLPGHKINDLIAAYRDMLRIEPDHADVRYRLDLLVKEQTARRKKRRLLIIGVSSVVLLLILIWIYAVYIEMPAREEFKILKTEVDQLIANKKYEEAVQKYRQFGTGLAFLTKRSVRREIRTLDQKISEIEGQTSRTTADDVARLRKSFDDLRIREKKDQFEPILAAYKKILVETEKKKYNDLIPFVKRRVDFLSKYLNEANTLAQKASMSDRSDRIAEARKAIMTLAEKYPQSKAAQSAKLPVKVNSVPTGAKIWINEKKQGVTPLKLYLPIHKPVSLIIARKGFKALRKDVKSYEQATLNFKLAKSLKWACLTNGSVEGSVAVDGGRLYVGSRDGSLYAVNLSDGQLQWRFRTEQSNDIVGTPCIRKPFVYVSCYDTFLYAVRLTTGRKVWATKLGGRLQAGPVLSPDGRTIYIGSDDKYIYAVDSTSGDVRWRFLTDGSVSKNCVVNSRVVYVVSGAGTLYAINAKTGRENWRLKFESRLTTVPCLVKNMLYLGSANGQLVALNVLDRKIKWRYKTKAGINSTPIYAQGKILVGSDDAWLHVISASAGTPVWKFKTGGAVRSAPAVSSDGFVYLASHDGYFYALDLAKGGLVWNYKIGKKLSAAPVVANDLVILGSTDRKIYAFDR